MENKVYIATIMGKLTTYLNLSRPEAGVFIWLSIWAVLFSSMYFIPRFLKKGIKPRYIAIPAAVIFIDSPLQAYRNFISGNGGLFRTTYGILLPFIMYIMAIEIILSIEELVKRKKEGLEEIGWKIWLRRTVVYSVILIGTIGGAWLVYLYLSDLS